MARRRTYKRDRIGRFAKVGRAVVSAKAANTRRVDRRNDRRNNRFDSRNSARIQRRETELRTRANARGKRSRVLERQAFRKQVAVGAGEGAAKVVKTVAVGVALNYVGVKSPTLSRSLSTPQFGLAVNLAARRIGSTSRADRVDAAVLRRLPTGKENRLQNGRIRNLAAGDAGSRAIGNFAGGTAAQIGSVKTFRTINRLSNNVDAQQRFTGNLRGRAANRANAASRGLPSTSAPRIQAVRVNRKGVYNISSGGAKLRKARIR